MTFRAEGPNREKDLERQKAEYLKNGGNPDAEFIFFNQSFLTDSYKNCFFRIQMNFKANCGGIFML